MRDTTKTFLNEVLAANLLPSLLFAGYVYLTKGSDIWLATMIFVVVELVIGWVVRIKIEAKINEECRFIWRHKDDPEMKELIEENINVYKPSKENEE